MLSWKSEDFVTLFIQRLFSWYRVENDIFLSVHLGLFSFFLSLHLSLSIYIEYTYIFTYISQRRRYPNEEDG